MASLLEETISEIDDSNNEYHIVCHCNEVISLCGLDVSDDELIGTLDGNEDMINCIDCYVADKDPFYACPKCGG